MTTETEIVYVLINDAMPGLIKIGVTNQADLETRMRQLYTTGVPLPFACYYACRVPADRNVEKRLHFAFSSNRINENREFFKLEPEKVKSLLEMVKVSDITEEVEKEIEENINEADKVASDKMKKRRPTMNFKEMNLPIGSELVFKDGIEKCIIVDERKVNYKGEILSLTAVTQKILGNTFAVQPSPHWLFQGKTLYAIYEETYSSHE